MREFLMISLSVALVCLGWLDVTTADQKCHQRGGTCKYTSNSCNGKYWTGYCNGGRNRRCCIPGSVRRDRRCIKKGGHCMDHRTNSCDGKYKSRYCPGNRHRRCCIGSIGLSDGCLKCICEIEGCKRNLGKCRYDVNSDSCGPYQIKNVYYIDCNKPGSNWRSCTKRMACSETCIHAYMKRYGDSCAISAGHKKATCQDYARVHNGGPQGCRRSYTLGYWIKISACCKRNGGC